MIDEEKQKENPDLEKIKTLEDKIVSKEARAEAKRELDELRLRKQTKIEKDALEEEREIVDQTLQDIEDEHYTTESDVAQEFKAQFFNTVEQFDAELDNVKYTVANVRNILKNLIVDETAVKKILDVMPRGNTLADRSARKEILREAFEYKQGREGFFAMVRAFKMDESP